MDPIFTEQIRTMMKRIEQLTKDMVDVKEGLLKVSELLVSLTEKKEKPAK